MISLWSIHSVSPFFDNFHYSQTFSKLIYSFNQMKYPLTHDGKYWIIKGRLWRVTNPHLSDAVRDKWVHELMRARRAVKAAKSSDDSQALAAARAAVDKAKVALGERGPVWWDDGSPDFNRYLIKNTPYHDWYKQLESK